MIVTCASGGDYGIGDGSNGSDSVAVGVVTVLMMAAVATILIVFKCW